MPQKTRHWVRLVWKKCPVSTVHGRFMVSWNTKKKCIHHFTNLLFIPIMHMQEFQKYGNKWNLMWVFWVTSNIGTANLAQSLALFCPVLVCPQKSIMGFQFLAFFFKFVHQIGTKKVVNFWKSFIFYFWYSATP